MSGELISLFDPSTPASEASSGQPHALALAPPEGWPAPPDQAAYHGLPGQIVAKIAPHTEADRATRGRTLRVNAQDRRID